MTSSGEWVCIHAGTSLPEPGVGTDWQNYWLRRSFAAGDAITLLTNDLTYTPWAEKWNSFDRGAVVTAFPEGTIERFFCATPHTADESYIHTETGVEYWEEFAAHTTELPDDGTIPTSTPWVAIIPWDTINDSQDFIGLLVLYSGEYYRQTAYPRTTLPDTLTGWEVLDVTSETDFDGWHASGRYAVGEKVSAFLKIFTVTASHIPMSANRPVDGDDWEDFWVDKSTFIESYEEGVRSPGLYYRLSPERDASDFESEIAADEASNGGTSPLLVVQGGWNLFTYGTWDGTFVLERSVNFGNSWEAARSYHSAGDRNVADSGTEDSPVWLRIRWHYNAAPDSQTPPRAVLIPESATVTGYALMTTYVGRDCMTGTARTSLLSGRVWRWSEGAFSSRRGFPRALGMIDSRLVFASTAMNPVSLWFSQVNDLIDFEPGTDDDAGIFATLATGSQQPIRWMVGGRRLFLGTSVGEWVAGSDTTDLPITPGNFQVREYSAVGSMKHQPVKLGDGIVFLGRKGTRVFELAPSPTNDTFVAQELTRLADHLTRAGVVSMAFQQTREPCLWCVSKAGGLLSFHYSKADSISAWAQHDTTGGLFREVLVFPSDDGDDHVFFIVQRGTAMKLERFPQHWQATQEAGTVGRYVDGSGNAAIASELKFLPMDLNTKDSGTTHGRLKRCHEMLVQTYLSYGGGVSYDGDRVDFQCLSTSDPMDTAPALRSGWQAATLSPAHVVDLQPSIVHDSPYPFTVRAVLLRWAVHEP